MSNYEEDEIERPSKTALKKEMEALQKIGEQLVKLSNNELAKIAIEDPTLIEAISTARRIKSREGLRRQMQYVGKIMRRIDISKITAALEERENGQRELSREFQALEVLRDELVSGGNKTIDHVIDVYPNAERQRIRQLVMQANKEIKNNKPPAAKRKLFRYLRELHEDSLEQQ